jgi:tellurite resistance protein TerC
VKKVVMYRKTARRLIVLVVGGTVLLLGVAMLVLPGPAIVVIPLGVLILAGEFAWARRLRRRMKELADLAGVQGSEELQERDPE